MYFRFNAKSGSLSTPKIPANAKPTDTLSESTLPSPPSCPRLVCCKFLPWQISLYETFFSSQVIAWYSIADRMQRSTMLIITRSSLKRCEYKVTELGIPSSLDNRLHNGLFL